MASMVVPMLLISTFPFNFGETLFQPALPLPWHPLYMRTGKYNISHYSQVRPRRTLPFCLQQPGSPFLGTDLKSWDQFSLIIHIQQRADIQHRAEKAAGLGNTASSDIKRKICGKKPVMQVQLVFLRPGMNLLNGSALIPKVCKFIHKKPISGGCSQRIHHQDLTPRIFFLQIRFCNVS